MICELGDVKLFELCETVPKVLCYHCLLYWNQGIVYCTWGQCLIVSEARRKLNKLSSGALTFPNFVIKKGPWCSTSQDQRTEYHTAWNAWKRCCKKVDSQGEHFTNIHDRFLRDPIYRESQLAIGWREQKVQRVGRTCKRRPYISSHSIKKKIPGQPEWPPPPPPQESHPDAGKARNDFWSMSGNFTYRQHVEPRVKLHSPFPIPLKYIDVRTTHTNLILCEKVASTILEHRWMKRFVWFLDKFHSITLLEEKPPNGYMWSGWETDKKAANIQARLIMSGTLHEMVKKCLAEGEAKVVTRKAQTR